MQGKEPLRCPVCGRDLTIYYAPPFGEDVETHFKCLCCGFDTWEVERGRGESSPQQVHRALKEFLIRSES